MAQVVYAPRALQDLERLIDFMLAQEPSLAAPALARIESAVSLLVEHPLIGRRVEHGLRELVISRGRTGFLALYDFDEARDLVFVLAIRHQREAGYEED